MTPTEFMSGLGTIVLIASMVVAGCTALLLLIVSIWPNFLNNWKSPGSSVRAKIKDNDPYKQFNTLPPSQSRDEHAA